MALELRWCYRPLLSSTCSDVTGLAEVIVTVTWMAKYMHLVHFRHCDVSKTFGWQA